jgi:hypothetical protein
MKPFYFTLSMNQGGPGCIEVIAENSIEARKKMLEEYGNNWAFQYDDIFDVHPLDREIMATIGKVQ